MKTISLSIPSEAQLTSISRSTTYITQAVLTRRIDILPGEPFAVKASEIPRLFDDDPATLSDINWLRTLIAAAQGSCSQPTRLGPIKREAPFRTLK